MFKERVETRYGTCMLTLDFRHVSKSPPLVSSPPMGVFKHPLATSMFKPFASKERPSLSQDRPQMDVEATHNRLVQALVA